MLRQALSHTPKECKCTRDKSPISNTGLCLRWNAVYQLTCNSCDQQCIGSTTRFIHDHVKEHLNNENLLWKLHIFSCQNKNYKGFDVKVIISENDPANLRLYEALESASLHSVLGKNVVNLQTFYFSILSYGPFFRTFRGPLSGNGLSLEPCVPFTVYFYSFHT